MQARGKSMKNHALRVWHGVCSIGLVSSFNRATIATEATTLWCLPIGYFVRNQTVSVRVS
jgi:hypothetical protein